jgi:hypothetical protein
LREVAESFNAAVESLTIAGPTAGIAGRPILAKEPRMVHFFSPGPSRHDRARSVRTDSNGALIPTPKLVAEVYLRKLGWQQLGKLIRGATPHFHGEFDERSNLILRQIVVRTMGMQ